MKLLPRRRKPETDEEQGKPVLVTDASVKAERPADAPVPESDPLVHLLATADSEIEAEEKAPDPEETLPEKDDSLDPNLLDIFRDAKKEVQESTLASELEYVAIQDLLIDLLNVCRLLGISLQARTALGQDRKPRP